MLHKSGSNQIFPVEVTESYMQSLTHQVMVHVTSHVHRTCLVIRPLSCVIIRKVMSVTETVEERQIRKDLMNRSSRITVNNQLNARCRK